MKTFLKILIVPILLLIGVSGIKATERLYIEEFNISPGNSRSVGIELSNSGVYTGFQADIELPEGLNLTLQNGEAEVNLSSRADASHMLVSNRLADGTWRIVCFSSENVPFSGTEGELLTIRLKSDAQFAGGSVTIKNILFTNTNNQDVAFLENTTQIGITEENSLSTEPLTIENEGEYPVTINLKNDTEFSAFQFDIILPEELSVVENTLALTSRLSASHNLTQTIDGNKIRVLAISVSNAPITGSKGGILTFNVKAEKNIVAQGEMKLQNILFSTANANEYILENSTVAVSINVPLTLYTISVSSSDESMGSATASETEVEEGETVILTATPKDGYKFTNWTLGGEVVSTDNPYQATITANSEFVANFEALPTSGKFEAVNSDGVTIWYNITSYNTAEVTYKGSSYNEYSGEYSGEVNIPSTVEYSGNTYSVTSIGDGAFRNCRGLTSVTIPESVTTIGDYAFSYCDGLTSVTIPESVTSIGSSAFFYCRGLTSVTIPEGVTAIEDRAFYYCDGLTSVIIPESVTSIGDYAFLICLGLTEIEVAENNTNYSSEEGVLFNKDKTKLIQYPIGNSRTSYSIPESVTTIGDYAFSYCDGLTSVTIPEGVTAIEDRAFYYCDGLTSVIIPESVTSIGGDAFSDCDGLTEIEVAENNTNYSSEEGVLFNKDKTKLIQYPIGNSRTSYSIPESVTSIGSYAFYNCTGLTGIYSLNPVAPTIYSTTFDYVSKTIPVYIPKGSLSSYQSTEYWSEFTNFVKLGIYIISVSSSDESMGSATASETEVEEGATVTLTATPKDGYTFTNWTLGGEVVSTDNPYQATITANSEFVANFEALPKGTFEKNNSGGVTIWYKITSDNSVEVTYKGRSYDEYSGEYSGEVNIPSTVEYSGNTYSVTAIEEYAFWGCDGLTSVTIPESVTAIGMRAFNGCDGLTGVYISNLTAWCNIDFSDAVRNNISNPLRTAKKLYLNNELITDLVIPNSISEIKEYTFYGCSSLISVTIPESVTSIGSYAFRNCSGLTSVTISEGVTSIGSYAFLGCTGLTSVTIPESVTSIEGYAFSNCTGLTEIYSLNPVAPTIYSTTFYYVPKIIPVYIPKGSLSSYQSTEYWSEFTNFVEIKEIYTISVSSSDEGMGSATASETEVEEGATVILTATPKDGYKFTNWTLGGEVVSTDNPYQATITANSEFVANFEELKDKEVIEDEVTNKDENLGNVEIASEENKDVILDINTHIFKAENITINVDKEGNSPQIQISIGGEVVSKKIEVVRNVKGGIWDMLSLPFDVNISDITVEGVPAEIGVNILLQYYDGAFRAEHSIEGETANAWKAISSGIIPANQGFAIAINSRYDGDVQEVSFSGNDFAMDSEEKELTLKRHESSVNKGMDADWNFLGNPTLSNQAKESGYSLYLYNTESDSYSEYSSSMATTIKPFSAWFVQSAQDFMSMIFGTRPKAMKSADETVEGTLSLNINGDDDATIIINPEATEGYQRNEDALYMASPNGNLSQLYIINDGVEMAVSEQPEEASTIAIGYKAVKAGEQTLTLTSVPDGTEVTLTDNHTGTVTQMSLGDSYNFESAAGTYKNRFSLNMTDMTSIGQTETTGTIKAVVTNDEVKLYGTTEGAEITLYTANGMLITQAMAEEGITTIPTTASGVIIIKVGTETIKAVK